MSASMMSLKPKSTELEASEEFVTLTFQFRSVEEADRAYDEIEKAMLAGLLTVSCGTPEAKPDDQVLQ